MKRRITVLEFLKEHKIHPLTERERYVPYVREHPEEFIDCQDWFPDLEKSERSK